MPKYKLVAIDLDDTLLSDDLKISPRTVEAIQETIKRGVTVTFATGRMYQSAAKYAEEIKLDVPIITYQGAYVKNIKEQEVLYQKLLTFECSEKIIRLLKERQVSVQIYLNDELYVERNNPYIDGYSKHSNVSYHVVDDLIEAIRESHTTPMKILAIDDPDRISKLLNEFESIFNESIQINISKPSFLEFAHAEATKGKAIKFIAEKLGISMEQVIAIGDSFNDYDMIKMAGLGVAMDNSYPVIKAVADYVTKSNNDEGVWEVLHRFILQENEGE